MMHVTFTKEPEAVAYQAAADKACGYPTSDHNHRGGGRHVVVDPKKPGPGWTMHYDEPRKHPSKEEWCHVAVAVPSAAVVADKELSLADVATLSDAEAKELTADWYEEAEEPKPVDDVKTVTR